jgi:hypothetical protein
VTQLWPDDAAGTATAGPPAPRPASVKWASILLILAAWMILLPVAALIYELVSLDDVIRRAAQRTGAGADVVDTQRLATQVITGVGIALLVLMAAALFFPALALRRGGRGARTAAVATSVLSLLCCGGGVGLAILGSQTSSQTSDFETELTRLSTEETPAWVEYATLAGAAAPVLAIVAIILLYTPAANRYFGRRDDAEAAGYQYGGYYAYPARYTGSRTDEPEPAANEEPAAPSDDPPRN